MTAKPLNPDLYARLERLCGPVRITAAGAARRAVACGVSAKGRPRERVIDYGETYYCTCTECGAAYKLAVSAQYGKRSPITGYPHRSIKCMHEDCFGGADWKRRQDEFAAMLEASHFGRPLAKARVREGERRKPVKPRPPGPITLLSDLPANHKARRYVEGRCFDPDVLSRFWDVGYCARAVYEDCRLAGDRLYIPYSFRGKFHGWQCRMLEDQPKHVKFPPKCVSMPGLEKSRMLYNLDNARRWRTGVIVEGPFDVFGMGRCAAAVFGDRVSYPQMELIVEAWGRPGRTVVILLDPAEMVKDHTLLMVEELRRMIGRDRVAAVKLPDDTDPGSLDRQWMRNFVRQKARKQGVKVRWEKDE